MRQRLGLSLAAVFCSIPLVLTGCAAGGNVGGGAPTNNEPGAEQPGSNTGSGGSKGTATATIDGTDFTFEPAFCAVTDEDTLIHGPGTSSTGEDAYLDIDFVYLDGKWSGDVRIKLGVKTQFSSPDDYYLLTTYHDMGEKLIANSAATNMFSATGTYLVSGNEPGVNGKVEVNCK
jgi:hypothetical protein